MRSVSIYYVYLDIVDEWLADKDGTSHKDITEAMEFSVESEAMKAAEEYDGMALGWIQ